LDLGDVSISDLAVADARRIAHDLTIIDSIDMKQRADERATFEARAARYRALTVKPAVSEEERKYIVQAEFLTRHKDYAGAMTHYQEAIKLDPVSYPAAYFNLALLNAQVMHYGAAIRYMNQYLLLVPPDTKDARSAQDKIYGWEAMMGK
jgi:tetratricopeptide (TPR) repeat protein